MDSVFLVTKATGRFCKNFIYLIFKRKSMRSHHTLDSPVGQILLLAENDVLVRLEFPGKPHAMGIPEKSETGSPFLQEVSNQLTQYFDGTRQTFDIAVDLRGTHFQQRVWGHLQDIPWGETRSYGQLADQVGNKGASRAVGAANGRNPISIILPCHRVIGGNGHITGYAGGLKAKQWLLQHEGWTG